MKLSKEQKIQTLVTLMAHYDGKDSGLCETSFGLRMNNVFDHAEFLYINNLIRSYNATRKTGFSGRASEHRTRKRFQMNSHYWLWKPYAIKPRLKWINSQLKKLQQ